MGGTMGHLALGHLVLGGALIGLALALLRTATGRVMSASRMIGSLLGGHEGPAAASMAFIAGLVIAPTVLVLLGEPTAKPLEGNWALLALGGVLVGLGARLGDTGLVAAIWGGAGGSGRSAAVLCAMIASAGLSLFLFDLLVRGGPS
jgi:hypothetical protein